MDRLFVYGSLKPNEKNNFLLSKINGTWRTAFTYGFVKKIYLGPKEIYDALILDNNGDRIEGYLFYSYALKNLWKKLDIFEGSNYKRLETNININNKHKVKAFVYLLKNN
jgi:gamma-glutamylcyclotransferase (GGCT)/AIG2-like uncharacterized protein YtfP